MESNHVPLDTLSVEFAVLPPHSQVLLFPNPLVVLKLAVHLPLNVLPLLTCSGWASVSCVLEPESLSASVSWRMSSQVPQSKTQCHGLTDSQCEYGVWPGRPDMRLPCKSRRYSYIMIQLLDSVIHYVADCCCSECATMSYLLSLSWSYILGYRYFIDNHYSNPGLVQRWCCCQPLRKWQAFEAKQH